MGNRVTIVDIDIAFGKMVGIIIKWSLASIPAMIILSIILSIIFAIITAIFGGILAGLGGLF